MNDIKYSIITRVYNAETTLSRCIESVVKQSYKNWELILVNDGSTDGSLNICNSFCSLDSRIKVIDQKNQGGAKAQIIGFDNVSGDFFFDLDSDDWLEADSLQIINKYITEDNIDLLIYGINQYDENGILFDSIKFSESPKVMDRVQTVKFVLESSFHGLIKVHKKDLLCYNKQEDEFIKNNLSYFVMNNDFLLGIPLLFNVKKAIVIPECLYNYEIRSSSVSHQKKPFLKLNIACKSYAFLNLVFKVHKIEDETIYNLAMKELAREVIPNIYDIIRYNSNKVSLIREVFFNLTNTKVLKYILENKLLKHYKLKFRISFYVFLILGNSLCHL